MAGGVEELSKVRLRCIHLGPYLFTYKYPQDDSNECSQSVHSASLWSEKELTSSSDVYSRAGLYPLTEQHLTKESLTGV